MKIPAFFSLILATTALADDPTAKLKPLMAVPATVVLEHDFEKDGPVDRADWTPRQGTRWTAKGGMLLGQPSTAEYQANKKNHKGLEPRTSVPKTPREFVIQFSVRFIEGKETAIVPFVEFGHHVCRMKFRQEGGLIIIADGESVRVAEAPNFKLEFGKWYHALAELKGDEFVIQFVDGPTLYAHHECFAEKNSSGGNGLGIAGATTGNVEIDNVTIWNIKPTPQASWADRKATFPTYKHLPTGKKKKIKKAKS